jgi:D-alanyl-D-alanine endopeptidase (penicillin-binding protein 7)
MNNRAVEIGMHNTVFHEPTGLNKDNVSTAQDLLKLMLVAATIDVVSTISSQPIATVEINENTLHVRNTNPFTLKHNITLSKTGFTVAAGGCLVMILESAVGTRILILLGSKNARTRIPDMERLINNL